ncbi:MAG: UDP-N-acetylmuramoyl-tripeptide--D-alanyl-D-alanine ligase [Acidimicrobiales bacterium]|nr:UDP-N-acetylmuramoyl-tripeptide--D-alanyl-D-alanine ligase [Acidimicrobiales bacterium]
MEFTTDEIVESTGGSVIGPAAVAHGVTIDSRSVTGGELFVPIVAERDGHDFVGSATAAGATVYLTARADLDLDTAGATGVLVENTLAGLQSIGRLARRRVTGDVVGVTGSVGKTSTKDLAVAVLTTERRAHGSYRSFNNEMGVPLTLANAPEETEVVVVEMGARGRFHISELCDVAAPTVGVVTSVGLAHTELFGSIEEVELAKGELVEALAPSGTAVLNIDDERVRAMASRTDAAVLTYGHRSRHLAPDLVAEEVEIGADLAPSFVLHSPWGSVEVRLAVRGMHHVGNALAAAAVGLACGVSLDGVAAGLGRSELSPHRMDLRRLDSGATVLNDAYNANPLSMEAALRSLVAIPGRRHVAVLGQMAELGPEHHRAHVEIGELAATLGVEVIAVDVAEYGGHLVADLDAAASELGTPGVGDVILLKGSRVVGLERLAERLGAC